MKNLRTIREEKKYTQQQIADFLNITKSSYSRYERGLRNVTPDTLIKLSEFFDVTTDFLLDITSEPLSRAEINILFSSSKSNTELMKEFKFNSSGESITPEEIEILLNKLRLLIQSKK